MYRANGQLKGHPIKLIDIRKSKQKLNLSDSIRSGLKEEDGAPCSLPSLLLWDEQGLQCFEDITYTPEYYLTNAEINLLEENAEEIARSLEPGSILLELGSGNLRKTNILLQAVNRHSRDVHYYALDLDENELVRTLSQLDPCSLSNVTCHGLLGTYDDGLEWLLTRANYAPRSICIMMLGSTLGGMDHDEAGQFLRDWLRALAKRSDKIKARRDTFLLGLDCCTDVERVFPAYNDGQGCNKKFILNAIQHANTHLGYPALNPDDWTVFGSWNASKARHEQYLEPRYDITFEGCPLQKHKPVLVACSHKYSEDGLKRLWTNCKSRQVTRFANNDQSYGTSK